MTQAIDPGRTKPKRRLGFVLTCRMRVLFLDDNPDRHVITDRQYAGHEIVHCWSIQSFEIALETFNSFDVVSLDHDLNDFDARSESCGRELTGLDACGIIAARFAEKMPETVIIHSVNPCGAVAMRNLLQSRGIGARWIPFACPEPDETDPFWRP